jgi:putative CocE/NonD family hydrolase
MRRTSVALAALVGLLGTLLPGALVARASATVAWKPDPARYGVATAFDRPITMPDGRVLRADILRPTDPSTGQLARGPFPVILSLTPYGKSVSNPIDPYLVQRGYLGVAVDVAGTGGSHGESQLFGPVEASDSAILVRWAAHLPHSSGVVGMVGGSYLGIDQLFAAAAVGPGSPLKAIFPVAAASDPYRDLFVSGGLMNAESSLGLLGLYGGTRTLTPLAERNSDPADASDLTVEHALATVPFEGRTFLDTLSSTGRRFDGPYWQSRAPQNVLPQIVRNGVAVYLVGGDYDVFQRGEPLLYSGLQNAAAGRSVYAPMAPGQPASPKYQLLFGPWFHGNQGQGADLVDLELRWFDQWLKGRDTGILDTRTPLHVIEPGGRRYSVADYPVETAPSTPLHLSPAGGLQASPNGLAGPDKTVVFTMASWPCGRSTQQWSAGVVPESMCGAHEQVPGPIPGEVAYATPRLSAPMTLAGPVGLTLHATATTPDTAWVATLDDVAPDGTVTHLTSGALLGSFRAIDQRRSWPSGDGGFRLAVHPLTRASQTPVVPGHLTRYDIELRPIFATLPAGHQLRLVIGTGDVPHLLPTPLDGSHLLGGVYQIAHATEGGSWLNLPIVP